MKLTIGLKPKSTIAVDEVIHLKIISLGAVMQTQDVTPLKGARVIYECGICGVGEDAHEDGSLPKGWMAKSLENGNYIFFCDSDCSTNVPYCRVCGCTESHACPDDGSGNPCHWVERDLCSACVPIPPKVKCPYCR